MQCLSRVRTRHNLTVNAEGRFIKLLSIFDYRMRLLKLMGLILFALLIFLLRQVPYHPITIMGNTVYACVAAHTLTRCKIPHLFCKGTKRLPYYETNNGEEIAFEGPSRTHFNSDATVLIPLLSEDITCLQAHTHLSHLASVQAQLLSTFPTQNTIHLISSAELMKEIPTKNPVLSVRRLCGLYYIMTLEEVWISRLVLSDFVLPVQPGERVISTKITTMNHLSDTCEITRTPTSCTISKPQIKMTLTHHYNHEVAYDYSIQGTGCSDNMLYSLAVPRSFPTVMHTIHPFHLPETWDIFLTIMIVTLALSTTLTCI